MITEILGLISEKKDSFLRAIAHYQYCPGLSSVYKKEYPDVQYTGIGEQTKFSLSKEKISDNGQQRPLK
jgi:hypothetical protein